MMPLKGKLVSVIDSMKRANLEGVYYHMLQGQGPEWLG